MKATSFRTICGFCHAGCGLLVQVDAGGIINVEGDPDHPANKGYICSKAKVAKEMVESPDRLLQPLRKTRGGLKPVSWDEALDFAADKLTGIRNKYGPCSLVRNAGAPVSYEARDGFLHFMQVFGSPNFTGSSNNCMLPRMTAFASVMGGKPEPDFEKAGLIIFWGANPVATERYGNYCAYDGFNKVIARARARGARVVAIDPVRSETVVQAGEWVAIKPGTDAALGLAMIHVILREELYDRNFIENYTSGFESLKTHVRNFTPDWAADITGIDQAVICELARAFATTKPATICDGNGFDMYCNVVDAVRVVAILLGLTGNVDVPGGVAFLPFVKQPLLTSMSTSNQIWADQFPLFKDVPFPGIKESLLRHEDYRARAMIVHHSNPVLIQANQARTKRAFELLEFLMVDDIFMTATAEIADLVLPSTSMPERHGYKAYSSFNNGLLALGRPVVSPPGEARDVFWMEYEIAKRMGLADNYPFKDSKSWVEYMLKPSGINLEQLEKEQIVYVTPEPMYEKFKTNGFQTPSGKLEFHSQQFETAGYSPLPSFSDPSGRPLDAASRTSRAFPLLCTSRRPAQFVHTKFRNLATLARAYPEPYLWMTPEDAAARGLAQGDLIELSSPNGNVRIRLKHKVDLQAGLVMMDFGWGNPTDGKASANSLTSDEYWNPVSGTSSLRLFPCEVVKTGS